MSGYFVTDISGQNFGINLPVRAVQDSRRLKTQYEGPYLYLFIYLFACKLNNCRNIQMGIINGNVLLEFERNNDNILCKIRHGKKIR
jgi:hypothetical protein